MNSIKTHTANPQELMAGGVSIGWALSQLASRHPHHEAHQAVSFSTLLKALLALRDRQMLSDAQFSEFVETACTVLIEKRVAQAVDRVIDHQSNVSVLAKLLSKSNG